MARPLAKHTKNGELYTRLPATEQQIDEVLNVPQERVLTCAETVEAGESGFIRSETLVHLYRVARRSNDQKGMYALVTVLLSRCERLLAGKIRSSRWANVDELREEALGQFSELLATDDSAEDCDGLDFFEVGFNAAFKALYINVMRKFGQRGHITPLPGGDVEDESLADETRFAMLSSALSVPPTQEIDAAKQELHDAIYALPDDERRAVVMKFMMGYPVESEDGKKQTVATLCGVSGRTIRERLARAYARLAPYVEAIRL